MRDALAEDLARFLGASAGVGLSRIGGPEGLYPQERDAIASATGKRQAEFAAGRRAARAALGQIGHEAVAVVPGPGREPLWPSGILGSITHDAGVAVAAVMPDRFARGVGIDLTESEPLSDGLRQEILPHADEDGLDAVGARIGFSAKESLFKALFPIVGEYFGFDAAIVRHVSGSERFEVDLTLPIGPFPRGASWAGHVWRSEDLVLTAIRL